MEEEAILRIVYLLTHGNHLDAGVEIYSSG